MPQAENITQTTVLVLDGTNTLGLAAAVDPLRAANRHAGRRLYAWTFATPATADVTLTSGLTVPANPLARIPRCDLLLVVASFATDPQCSAPLLAGLRRLAAGAQQIAGTDGGPWVLARAGLLAGHTATTHWEDLDTFAQQFPDTRTVNARHHSSGKFHTAGGAAPTLDMMLGLIARAHGPTLAARVAASFVLDTQPQPAARPQSRRPPPAIATPTIARAHRLMEAHLDTPLPLAIIARRLGLSPRALQLQFRQHLHSTPQAHYMSLRMAEAERLVMTTRRTLHDIALSTGFSSQSSFARSYRHAHGTDARSHRLRTLH